MFRKLFALSMLIALTTGANLTSANQAFAQPLPVTASSMQREETAVIHVDSRMDEPVAIYVEGEYVGTVLAGGDLYIEVDAGEHILRGVCDSGTYGPRYVELSGGETFHWELNGD